MALAYFDDEEPQNEVGFVGKSVARIFAIGFVILAFAAFAMLSSYSIDDPSLVTTSSNPPSNALGYMGAYVSDLLFRAIGVATWILPVAFLIWAVRLFFGLGGDVFRVIFLPLAMVVGAIFAASWVPSSNWPFLNTGMGGALGDAILRKVLEALPFGLGFALFLASLIFAALTLMATGFVCGFRFADYRAIGSKVIRDIQFCYQYFMGSDKLGSSRKPRAAKPARKQDENFFSKRATTQKTPNRAPSSFSGGATSKPKRALDIGGIFGEKTPDAQGAPLAAEARFQPTMGDMPFQSAPAIDEDDLRPQEPIPTGPLQSRIRAIVSRKASQHHEMLRIGGKNYFTKGESEGYDPEEKLDPPVTAQAQAIKPQPVQAQPATMQVDALEPFDFPEPEDPFFYTGEIEPSADVNLQSEPPAALRRPPVIAPSVQKKPQLSQRARAEAEPSLPLSQAFEPEFEMPPLSLLQNPATISRQVPPREALEASAAQLQAVLEDYGVKGEIVAVKPGPVVTMYELEPAPGLKANRVISLADDIARSMSALTARVATIPGRSVIGIELPNDNRETVLLREIFAAKNYGDSKLALPLALGKDIAGDPIVTNLAKMPHLLIAGTTGSGKSVAINTMILSLLYHASPDDVRMIMIDPKMLELSVYDDIPHLLSPVVTDPKKAVVALKWVVAEMEERYRKMSKMGVRNIDGYNGRVQAALDGGEAFTRTVQTGFDDLTGEPTFETEEYAPEKMPYIVVIVDEMADLMMVAGKEIEACIQRLAQMARASGIHLIMATQRPSVDVITGTIKANFPTRISFQVTSKIDSRTILGEMGAEQLLGQGDMLYMSGGGRVTRVHGPFVSDEEVEEVVRHLKAQGEPHYVSGVVDGPEDEKAASIDEVLGLGGGESGEDQLYDQAVLIVARDRKCSTSYIQRKLSIGYNKAAKLVERMEDEGVVSPANHVGKRDILVPEID